MSVIHNPHDHFFRGAMINRKVAKEFFEYHLPLEVRAYLDLNTLEFQPGVYVNKALEGSASDVLYKVNYLKKPGSAYLYVLVEHQSSVEHMMSFRLWQYIFSIWHELVKKNVKESQNKSYRLPLVIPLVFFNGPEKYNGVRDIRDLIAAPKELIESFFLQPFHLIDLHEISDKELRERQWSGLMEQSMKYVRAKEISHYIQSILDSVKFAWHQGDADFSEFVLKYVLSQAKTADPERLVEILKTGLAEEGNIMGTLVDYLTQQNKAVWLQSGLEQGLEQGLERGVQKGEGTLLMCQLEHKFKTSPIPERYKRQIEQASPEVLLKWGERMLDSLSLEEVFSDRESAAFQK